MKTQSLLTVIAAFWLFTSCGSNTTGGKTTDCCGEITASACQAIVKTTSGKVGGVHRKRYLYI